MTDITLSVILKLFLNLPSLTHRKVDGMDVDKQLVHQFNSLNQLFLSPMYILTERMPSEWIRKRNMINLELEEEIRARLTDIKAGKNVDQEDIILLLYRQNTNLSEAELVKNMVDELKIFLVAGSDTTSTLVTNCLYYLTTVPHIQASIQKEVDLYSLDNLTASIGK